MSGSLRDKLPPELYQRAILDPELASLLMEDRRRRARDSLVVWCEEYLRPLQQSPARHHRLICAELEGLERGDFDRLMILAPPGSAKSTYASVLFPPWFLARNSRTCVIAASHTGELADDFGRKVRNTVSEHPDLLGYSLAADSQAAGKWNTDVGGEYRTFGVGKAIAGRRADLCIIDDPVAGREAAESQADRDRVWRWYTGDVYGRLKPGARVVLIMTRWHEDDLGGRLLQEQATGGDQWRILSLPALAEGERVNKQTGEVIPAPIDPLGRRPGEALWPEWEDADKLLRKMRVSGSREWEAQYQQRPTPTEGVLFHVDKIPLRDAVPPDDPLEVACRAWDLAATEQVGTRDPDWTVGLLLGRLRSGRTIVMDVVRLQGDPHDVEAAICATAVSDGTEVVISLSQDPGQAGKAQVKFLVAKLAGWRVRTSPDTGSKSTRAMPVAAQAEVGNLLVLQRLWTRAFLSELATFPSGSKDDQVDALSRAFAELVPTGSAQAMLDYMTARLQQQTGPARRPVMGGVSGQLALQQEQTLVEIYHDTARRLTEQQAVVCFRCRQPLGSTRVEDGESSWHPECFS